MEDRERPIGVFDSGVGGIGTLAEITHWLPNEDFIYYGDTANAPYGTKDPQDILMYVERVVDHLLHQNVKAVVIACNTATSVAAQILRERLTIPIIGIEPALKPASEHRKNGSILILATPVTLHLQKFRLLMQRYGEGAIPLPCPGLMELVENEQDEAARDYLNDLLSDQDLFSTDSIVLGCTHYVFLRPMLKEILPKHIEVFDGNEGTAKQLKRVLESRELITPSSHQGKIAFETSGDPDATLPIMKRLFHKGLALSREMHN